MVQDARKYYNDYTSSSKFNTNTETANWVEIGTNVYVVVVVEKYYALGYKVRNL